MCFIIKYNACLFGLVRGKLNNINIVASTSAEGRGEADCALDRLCLIIILIIQSEYVSVICANIVYYN